MGNLGRGDEPVECGVSKSSGDYLARTVLGLPAMLSLGGKKQVMLDRGNSKLLTMEKDGSVVGAGLISGFETAGVEEVRVDFFGSDMDEESSQEGQCHSPDMETSSGEEEEMLQERGFNSHTSANSAGEDESPEYGFGKSLDGKPKRGMIHSIVVDGRRLVDAENGQNVEDLEALVVRQNKNGTQATWVAAVAVTNQGASIVLGGVSWKDLVANN